MKQNELTYSNPKKRQDKFNELRSNFAKIINKGELKEPGYRPNYETTSYMISIEGVDEIALEDTVFMKPEQTDLKQVNKEYFV